MIPRGRWTESSTAEEGNGSPYPVVVRVTHRFHPLFGRELEFVKRKKSWACDLVYVYDEDGDLVSVPIAWTDMAAEDPFVVMAAGRAPFRTGDLLAAAEVVEQLLRGWVQPSAGDGETSP